MKNFILGLLAAILLAIVGYAWVQCAQAIKTEIGGDSTPKEIVNEPVKQAQVFNSLDEVLQYHAVIAQQKYVEDVFASLPRRTIEAVASVCIKNNGLLTINRIVEEYEHNRHIYDALCSPDTVVYKKVEPKVLNRLEVKAPDPVPEESENTNNSPSTPPV